MLKCFYICCGLKANFHKSHLFGMGITDSDLQSQAQVLGCLKSSLRFTYLAVPVGANMVLKKNWKPITDKFQNRLSTWKEKTLSSGGRLLLIKSILNNLLTY